MDVAAATIRAQRLFVHAAVAAASVAFLPTLTDPFQLPKVTLIVLAAIGASAAGLLRAAVGRPRPQKAAIPMLAGAAVAVLALVATILADAPWLSLVGRQGRYGGAAAYCAYAALFACVVSAFDRRAIRRLALTWLASLALVCGYGLLQTLGWEPLSWKGASLRVFSTQGNANFLAGYLAMSMPLAFAASIFERELRVRLAAATVALISLPVTFATGSFQGPAAATAGMLAAAAVLAPWRTASPRRDALAGLWRRQRLPLFSVAAVVVALMAVAAPSAISFVRSGLESGLRTRVDYWTVAARVVKENAATGAGMDSYGNFFFIYRPASASKLGPELADSPHSVPLSMAVGGGAVLAAAYLTFVGAIGATLLRSVKRVNAGDRALLAGVGGAWVAYQAQSLVSIDVPALAVGHWVLAGCIVVLSKVEGIDGSRVPHGRRRRRRPSTAESRRARMASAVVIPIALALAWTVIRPIRADAQAATAERLSRRGIGAPAVPHADEAVRLAPWVARHWYVRTGAYEAAGRIEDARRSAARSAALEPGSTQYALLNAKLAQRAGDVEAADRWHDEALRRDPRSPYVAKDVALYEMSRGRGARAVRLMEKAVRIESEVYGLWAILAKAYRSVGDVAAARRAYARVLELEPLDTEAREFMTQ